MGYTATQTAEKQQDETMISLHAEKTQNIPEPNENTAEQPSSLYFRPNKGVQEIY